jgi:ribosomal protein S18 acetylase RimI-like enzyme
LVTGRTPRPPFAFFLEGVLSTYRSTAAMQVREAKLEDVAAVMGLVNRVVPQMRASGNLQWDDHYPNASVFERDVARAQLWVAEVDEHLAGVAAITTDQEPEYADVGWDLSEQAIVVHRLAVDPAFQGKGVAMALMLQAEAVGRTRGIAVLRVDTNTQNEATQRLFPKLGYVRAGEIGLGFRPGLRFQCYEKRLSTDGI